MSTPSWTGIAASIDRFRPWQILLLVACPIALFYAPVLTADFGIVDDHEIMAFLKDGRLDVPDIWRLLIAETEAGSPFETQRYRPAYYFLRLVETWAWADIPTLWYVARFAILVYFAFEAFRLVQRLMGPGYAITFLLSILFSRVFVDTFARLGPSEAYAVLGCALCLTAARRSATNGVSATDGLLVGAGTIIAVGSKENFVFLLLPLAMMLLALNRPAQLPARLAAFACFAGSLVIWSAVLPGTIGLGATIYGDSLPSLALLQSAPVLTSLVIALLAGIILLVAAKLILANPWLGRLDPDRRERLMWIAFFLAAIVLQLLVYRGLVTKNRYGFPAIPMVVFLILLAVSRLQEMLRDRAWPAMLKRTAPLVAAVVAVAATVVPETKSWKRLNNWVGDTHRFQARYATLRDALETPTPANVVLVAHSSRAYEPVAAVQRYLVKDYGEIKIAVSVEDNNEYTDAHRKLLIDTLKRRQEAGETGWVPLSEIDQSNCIAASFYGPTTKLPCPVVSEPWPVR